MINNVCLSGRLTRDPELRTTSTGKSVCDFSIAVNRRIKGADGTEADFFRVSCWGQSAEFVANYIRKGRMVGIQGRLEQRRWSQDGVSREAVQVVADHVCPLERSPDGDPPSQAEKADAPHDDGPLYDPFADDV